MTDLALEWVNNEGSMVHKAQLPGEYALPVLESALPQHLPAGLYYLRLQAGQAVFHATVQKM